MKEKLGTLWGLIKHYKKILIVLLVLVIAVIVLVNVLSTKPRNYKKKVEAMGKAFFDSSEMRDVIENGTIDLKGAVAWIEAYDDYEYKINIEDFEDELKDVEKDDKRIKTLKKALKEYVREDNGNGDVTNIKKAKQSKNNKDIWTVEASLDDEDITFIFYKGKIIDVANTDYFSEKDDGTIETTSIFEDAFSDYENEY